jgi:PAS domain S-box-containing protein
MTENGMALAHALRAIRRQPKVTTEQAPRASLAPKFPLSVLVVEDNLLDAELCMEFLSKAQFEVQYEIVTTPNQVLEQIRATNYDVILADYNLGDWNGMDVLDLLVREKCAVPFILLTTALGDETAVECIKHGVTDYVLKERMDRLPVAIYRALEHRASSKEHERFERQLKASERKFRALADAIPLAVFLEQGTRCCYVNRAGIELTGYSREHLLSTNFSELIPPDLRKDLAMQFNGGLDIEDPTTCYETQIRTKDGDLRWLNVTVGMFQLDGRLAALITAADVTDRRGALEKAGERTFEELASERLRSFASSDIHLAHIMQANSL